MSVCLECEHARVKPAFVRANGTEMRCHSLRRPGDHRETYGGPTFVPEPGEHDYLCFYNTDEEYLSRKPVTGDLDLEGVERCYERNGLGDREHFSARGEGEGGEE